MRKRFLQQEDTWKTHTDAGNRLCQLHRYPEGIPYYEQALATAETLLTEIDTVYQVAEIPVIELYIISCNNIAYCYWELNDLESSESYFLQSLEKMEALSKSKQVSQYVQHKALRELTRVAVAYLDFCKKSGRPCCTALPLAGWGLPDIPPSHHPSSFKS
ncbi:tetratricopeptide repeat protein [Chitinophaga nivalis]|uniref:Tetratricopeptide repeat protein n=1 Tax=Chitinophaga nivalis TaxID=2991709 RepID=A0ABT3IP81_9BACT|nr:tetratricopeptide repeat protein [Chitinophaga nivalis]MCW3464530.1 tetratricopeptide repeat protein [Chitinophaga nivalis]MCW3485779.1 tetratricopeptide repeat protein [Chitinophaga nivalis]